MPKLHVIYDPTDKLEVRSEPIASCKLKVATLSVPDDLGSVDIYNLATRLAGLLLEQLPSD
jgi:hypothetical protein